MSGERWDALRAAMIKLEPEARKRFGVPLVECDWVQVQQLAEGFEVERLSAIAALDQHEAALRDLRMS